MDLINPTNLNLTYNQMMLSLPYFIMLFGGMIAVVLGVTKSLGSPTVTKVVSIATTLVALGAVVHVWGEPAQPLFNRMLAADSFSNLFNFLLIATTGLVMLSSFSYLPKQGIEHAEYYGLMMFSCLGMMLLASALDLIVLFVALEIMSIAVYVLVGFRRIDVRSNEAALKYFILGSAASAVLLYGAALVYGATGTLYITDIVNSFQQQSGTNTLMILGSLLLLIGFLFKVAAVPFHMWMPDVYEGAPTVVTNFMTTALKAASFAAFLRVFEAVGYLDTSRAFESAHFRDVIWVVAVITMFLGNVIALAQRNFKRMLAYSSIAHTGYLLVGILAGSQVDGGYYSVIIYLVAYVVMNLGAFAIAAQLSESGDQYTDIQDFAGLGFKKPLLGFAMMVFMFSMAGVPPTVGFLGKYLMFSAAVQSGEVLLTVLAVLCSAISAYYYLRIIVIMYMREAIREFRPSFGASAAFVVAMTVILTLQLGLFPANLIEIAQRAAMSL